MTRFAGGHTWRWPIPDWESSDLGQRNAGKRGVDCKGSGSGPVNPLRDQHLGHRVVELILDLVIGSRRFSTFTFENAPEGLAIAPVAPVKKELLGLH